MRFGGSGSAFSSLPIRLRARTPETEVRSVRQRIGGAAGAGNEPDVLRFGGSGSASSSLLRNENLTPPSIPPLTPRMQPDSRKDKEPLSPSKGSNPPPSPGR